MAGKVNPIPEGYHTVTPYLIIDDPDAAIAFAKRAFGAKEIYVMRDDTGRIRHADIQVGDSRIMMGGAQPQWPAKQAMLHLYVEDVDATFKRAVEAGAKVLQEPTDQFYGDRSGGVEDSNGIMWWIATHTEDLTEAELAERAAAAKG